MRDGPQQDDARQDATNAHEAFIAFQQLTPDGFMMFHPVRSDAGEIVDLEWSFVNGAAGDIIDRQPEEMVGKRLLVEMPENRDEGLFDAYVSVIETGQTWQNEFYYDHGGITAWFRTIAAKVGDGIAISFADISEVRQGDERRKALLDSVPATIGVLSLDGVLLEVNERAVVTAGVDRDQLIGRPFWDCYWWGIDQETKDQLEQAVALAAKGQRVRYDVEIYNTGDQRVWVDFQIVPVFNSAGEVTELIPSGVDITERKMAEAQRELLIKELNHRVKNTLATIQSIAGQTIRTAGSLDDFRSSFSARLRSLAASHDLLVEFDRHEASLKALVQDQVLPFASEEQRLETDGDDILLPGEVAYSLGLVLHELATNASKYGALSAEEGIVNVAWRIETVGQSRKLFLTWVERDGPKVKQPVRRGFGTRLIERSLFSDDEGAVIEYNVDGLSCRLTLVLK